MVYQVWAQYKIPVGASASDPVALPELKAAKNSKTVKRAQLELYAKGCDAVVRLGGGAVVASAAVDAESLKMPDGSIQIPQGAILLYEIPDELVATATHASVIVDGTGTGSLYMKIGYGENV